MLWRVHTQRLILGCALLLIGGCVHRPASSVDTRVPSQALPPLSYYEAGGAVPQPLVREQITKRATWTLDRIELPARVPPELAGIAHATDAIEVFHYRPTQRSKGPHPLVLVSPILANSKFLADQFAIDLARHGMHTAIVPRKEIAPTPDDTLDLAEHEARLTVMRSRQALDWLLTQPGVDASRLGTFGISAGAITSAMVAGADDRFHAHVWMLGGGPLADVMATTSEDSFRAYRDGAAQATGMTGDEIQVRLREIMQTDPVRLAARIATKDVLLVLARHDKSVPYATGLALWRALGCPERITTPLGHYTTFLLLPWLQVQTLRFFRQRFGTDS